MGSVLNYDDITMNKLRSMKVDELYSTFGNMQSQHSDSILLDRELARRASAATIRAANSANIAAWATFVAAFIAALTFVTPLICRMF